MTEEAQHTSRIPASQESRGKSTVPAAATVLMVVCLVVAPTAFSPGGIAEPYDPSSTVLIPFTELTCEVHLAHESFQDGSSDVSLVCNVPGSIFHESVPSMFYTLDLPSKSFCLTDSTVSSTTLSVEDSSKCGLTNRIFDEIQQASNDRDTAVQLTIQQGQANALSGILHILDHSAAFVSTRNVAEVFPKSFSPVNATMLRGSGVAQEYFPSDENPHRQLASSRGRLRVAVFRISALDSVPTYPRTTQYDNIFSGAGSLANQLSLCSGYQVEISPCAPQAMEINVAMYASGADRLAVVSAAYPLALARIQRSEPLLYGGLSRLEDYADVLIFMVVSRITSESR
jgi:hypothetical protein